MIVGRLLLAAVLFFLYGPDSGSAARFSATTQVRTQTQGENNDTAAAPVYGGGVKEMGRTWIVRGATAEQLQGLDLLTDPNSTDVAVVHGTIADLLALPDHILVEQPGRFVPLLDTAIPALRLDTVHTALPGQGGATGRGVLLAIIDTGVDVDNADFRNSDGSTRFWRYWDQSIEGDRVASWLGFGSECDSVMINNGACDLDAEAVMAGVLPMGHGTHVAGIAGSSHERYRGAAPEATMVGVRALFDEASIILALEYVWRLKQQVGWPMVVNLSLGTNEGGHDGTAALEQWIAAHQKPGFVVVAAAGNEATKGGADEGGIHVRLGDDKGDGRLAVLQFGSILLGSLNLGLTEWYGTGETVDLLRIFELDSNNRILGSMVELSVTEQDQAGSAVLNSDADVLWARLYDSDLDRTSYAIAVSATGRNSLAGSRFGVQFAGSSDRIDGWVVDRSGVFVAAAAQQVTIDNQSNSFVTQWYGGDNTATITNPASGVGVLSVGSYVGRTSWPDGKGNFYGDTAVEEGKLSESSSQGPTRDERLKPEVVTPGQYVASTRSGGLSADAIPSQLKVDEDHWISFGTSMASPMVAGFVALMLERSPQLTTAEIRNLIITTARDPYDFWALPNAQFGYGVPDGSAVFDDAGWQLPTSDSQAPQISEFEISSEDDVWVVSWWTDEMADAEVTYRGDTEEQSRRIDSFDVHHQLSDRVPFEVEEIIISGADIAGNRYGPTSVSTGVGCGCRVGTGAGDYRPFLLIALCMLVWYRRQYAG